MPSLESFEKEKDLNDVSCSPTHDNTTQILPFAGMCFVVSAPKEKKDYLTKKLKEFGATTSSMLLKNKVTHFAIGAESIATSGTAVRDARSKGFIIVSIEELEEVLTFLDSHHSPEIQLEPKEITDVVHSKPETKSGILSKTLVINKPAPLVLVNRDIPAIEKLVPTEGSKYGDFELVLFGKNFQAGSNFKIRLECQNDPTNVIFGTKYEHHGTNSVCCTVPQGNFEKGIWLVSATNNALSSRPAWSIINPNITLSLEDTFNHSLSEINAMAEHEKKIAINLLESTLTTVQTALSTIQLLESNIYNQLDLLRNSGTPNQNQRKLTQHSESPTEDLMVSIQPSKTSEEVQLLVSSLRKALQSPNPSTGEAKISFTLTTRTESNEGIEVITQEIQETSLDTLFSESREIRIFISSPFLDMQEERDLMVKKVFPKLRKLCSERDVTLSYVDLRWGITGSQSQQGALLLMCLREIKNCNLFIGCYGERYGSCYDEDEIKELTEALTAPQVTNEFEDVWAIQNEDDEEEAFYEQMKQMDAQKFIGNNSNNATNAQQDKIQKLEEKNEIMKQTFEMARTEFPWIEKYKDRSMTEVEYRMILDRKYKGNQKESLFYFRDPYYVQELIGSLNSKPSEKPDESSENQPSNQTSTPEKQEVSEEEKEILRIFGKETNPRSYEKLMNIKNDVLESDVSDIKKAYLRPTQLSEVLFEDIKGILESKFPTGVTLTELQRERFRHHSYSKRLQKVYLPNEEYFMQIDKHISNAEVTFPLVIKGMGGIGKSSLLANWSERHLKHHPEDVVIPHFIGCPGSPTSANAKLILHRILSEINWIFGSKNSTPNVSLTTCDYDVVVEFPTRLQKIMEEKNKKNRRVILLIDGFDKLEAKDNAFDLVWFPQFFVPSNVRVVITTSSYSSNDETLTNHQKLALSCYETLKKRGYPELQLSSLKEGERKSILRLFLKEHGKQLEDSLELMIAGASQSSIPSFLRTLADDICAFQKHEELRNRIEYDLKAQNISQLYRITIERLQKDYSKNNIDVVKSFLGLLWASKTGLYLDLELSVVLEQEFGLFEQDWIELYVVLDDLLSTSSGLLTFSSNEIKKGIELQVLNSNEITKFHEKLAKFFASSPDLTERKITELPYQYQHSKNWAALRSFLCDWLVFDKLYTQQHEDDLFKYWNALEEASNSVQGGGNSDIDSGSSSDTSESDAKKSSSKKKSIVVTSYLDLLQNGSFPTGIVRGQLIFKLASFFQEMGHYDASEIAYLKAKEYYQNSTQPLEVANVDNSLANLYHIQGKYEQAEKILNEIITVYVQQKGERALEVAITLNRLSQVYMYIKNSEKSEYGKGACPVTIRLNKAKDTLTRALDICINNGSIGQNHTVTADIYYSLGCVDFMKGEQQSAEEYFLKSLKIKEKLFGDWHIEVSNVLNRLGTLYIELNQFNDAEECLKRALIIRENKLGEWHSRVAQSLKHMISLYEMIENYADAARCSTKALKIIRKVYGNSHPQTYTTLFRIGSIYSTMRDSPAMVALLAPKAKQAFQEKTTAQAKEYLNEAYKLSRKINGPDHDLTLEISKAILDLIPSPPPPPPPPHFHQQQQIQQQFQQWDIPQQYQQQSFGPPPPPPPQQHMQQQLQQQQQIQQQLLQQLQQNQASPYMNKPQWNISQQQQQWGTQMNSQQQNFVPPPPPPPPPPPVLISSPQQFQQQQQQQPQQQQQQIPRRSKNEEGGEEEEDDEDDEASFNAIEAEMQNVKSNLAKKGWSEKYVDARAAAINMLGREKRRLNFTKLEKKQMYK